MWSLRTLVRLRWIKAHQLEIIFVIDVACDKSLNAVRRRSVYAYRLKCLQSLFTSNEDNTDGKILQHYCKCILRAQPQFSHASGAVFAVILIQTNNAHMWRLFLLRRLSAGKLIITLAIVFTITYSSVK